MSMERPLSSRAFIWRISLISFSIALTLGLLFGAFDYRSRATFLKLILGEEKETENRTPKYSLMLLPNGRPQLYPLPAAKEVWECEAVVVGGSLGGVAAASHAMQTGVKTCLLELTPWLGGQISSQGVSAIDESVTMIQGRKFSFSWNAFKQLIKRQPVELPAGMKLNRRLSVAEINSCWVGKLCFPPKAGDRAALKLLKYSARLAPGSRWGTSIAFKGAEFDPTGQFITAIYAVKRIPREPNYIPEGRPSSELVNWYSWSPNAAFEKVPLRLEPPQGKKLIAIDATDTGELVAWARVPHRTGSESRTTTGEVNAAKKDNPECTQAFTFPFVLAIKNDAGLSRSALAQIKPEYSKAEHRREYSLIGFPMFEGRSFFKYRRILSTTRNARFDGSPAPGDMTLVNWNHGNNWKLMNPPLILSEEKLMQTGQYQNWMGGLSMSALQHAEYNALLFSEWLMETQINPQFPLAHLSGADSPLGTVSGLSMMPYIREGRRILGRQAYGQTEFAIREADIRNDLRGGRNFQPTAVALTHYDIDIQGCMYRNWKQPWEAESASVKEYYVRPIAIPLESLIPRGVDNLLIGGKGIAVTHIVNGVTRIHQSEWSIGAAAGTTAGWILRQNKADLTPATIVPKKLMPKLQRYMVRQGLRFD